MTHNPGVPNVQAAQWLQVQQRFTVMVNRYDVFVADADGNAVGPPVGFAQQKRLALREQVTIYTDESAREVVCSFKARNIMDLGATYDVFDGAGNALGSFRKDFARSLLRSTFWLEPAGAPPAMGQESNFAIALLRRFQDTIPLPIHFTFSADGQEVLSVRRAFAFRDAYKVHIPAPWLDRRLAIAMAVGLDALMAR